LSLEAAGPPVVSAFIAKATNGELSGLNSTHKAWSHVAYLDTPLLWSKGSSKVRDLNVRRSSEKLEYL
jgi:hypothetical protein